MINAITVHAQLDDDTKGLKLIQLISKIPRRFCIEFPTVGYLILMVFEEPGIHCNECSLRIHLIHIQFAELVQQESGTRICIFRVLHENL